MNCDAVVKRTRLAQGQPCLVRIPGCDGGGETTVAAHYRLAGMCGIGIKPSDLLASWCCDHCHAVVDGRKPAPEGWTRDQVRLAHAEGVMRTLERLERMGAIK